MAMNLDNKLVVGISSRALFDLEYENQIYEKEGLQAYLDYQIAHEKEILKYERYLHMAPGPLSSC